MYLIRYQSASDRKGVRLIVTTALLGLLVVLLAMMIAVAGLLVVHRLVPLSTRDSHTAPIGVVYAALYVMFGMVVGFSAYLVLNKYNTSENMVKTEAGNLEELYWLAEQLPEPERDEIQELAVSYARVVVDEEWPLMKDGQTSPRAGTLANDLRRSIEDFEPSTATEQAIYAQELERVHDLDQAREVRLLNVSEGLPPVLWFVLVSLGIDTILFTYFVGMNARWLHVLAVAALTGGIALIIFAIVVLDRPFGGDFRVGPDAFELVLDTIEANSTR
jgi:hypothetical protein